MIKNTSSRVMVFGTFDVLHRGHLNLFKQARKLAKNPFLIVSVARDANVKRIKSRRPENNERRRLAGVKGIKIVDRAVLGGVKNYLEHILKAKPAIIGLGYDQKAYTKNLSFLLRKKGLTVSIVRLKAYKPKIFKSSRLKFALNKGRIMKA